MYEQTTTDLDEVCGIQKWKVESVDQSLPCVRTITFDDGSFLEWPTSVDSVFEKGKMILVSVIRTPSNLQVFDGIVLQCTYTTEVSNLFLFSYGGLLVGLTKTMWSSLMNPLQGDTTPEKNNTCSLLVQYEY